MAKNYFDAEGEVLQVGDTITSSHGDARHEVSALITGQDGKDYAVVYVRSSCHRHTGAYDDLELPCDEVFKCA